LTFYPVAFGSKIKGDTLTRRRVLIRDNHFLSLNLFNFFYIFLNVFLNVFLFLLNKEHIIKKKIVFFVRKKEGWIRKGEIMIENYFVLI
jgi:hypothetical protein